MREKFRHAGHRSWDVGIIEVDVCGEHYAFVIVADARERRYYPISDTDLAYATAARALRARVEAVNWWAIPKRIQIEDPELVWAIRETETLDECRIVEVDRLLSMKWARVTAEKALRGDKEVEAEYLAAA